ncbi:winged helix-turn-helix transcriptional regulator [Spongisporangium articulatum]|uniref:Winged helix-turn-helix transcriptional regulator n=1 Tax=Spongisporangium articulatum TaxID=3362603 RepID=A0ABW8AMY3_9ACTN
MGTGFLADCPARLAVEVLADKWAAVTLFALNESPRRHGELAAAIGGVSRKVLTHTLRRLEEYGLVERRSPTAGHAEYALTELGRTLVEPIETLNDWSATYGPAVSDFHDRA